MTDATSRAVMWLAICSLGESRREWALAMRSEFYVAAAEGKPFAFAAGCLLAAWREMGNHEEGRSVLTNYAFALFIAIPMAVVQFGLALGFSSFLPKEGVSSGVLLAGATQNPLLVSSQASAIPCLLFLWILLGSAQLRLAWVLVDCDWARVVKVIALMMATMATLIMLMGALVLDVTYVALQSAATAIEILAVVALARRHARLDTSTPTLDWR